VAFDADWWPFVQELLRDPVVAADGHTYERQHIKEWLQKSDTSPMTNEPMDHKHLIPNLALRAVMEAYFGARSEMVQWSKEESEDSGVVQVWNMQQARLAVLLLSKANYVK